MGQTIYIDGVRQPPPMHHTKTCANCERQFQSNRSDAITCSDRCKLKRSRDGRRLLKVTAGKTADQIKDWLASESQATIIQLPDGPVRVHWKMSRAAMLFVDLYAKHIGATRDELMDDVASPLVAKWKREHGQ